MIKYYKRLGNFGYYRQVEDKGRYYCEEYWSGCKFWVSCQFHIPTPIPYSLLEITEELALKEIDAYHVMQELII